MEDNYTHTYSIAQNSWSEQAWGGLEETVRDLWELPEGR